MTLTIHKEEDGQRQLKVRVEVAEKRVEKAMRQTAQKLSREIRLPGFRPGKAPFSVVLRRLGRDAVRAEAAEGIAEEVFKEMLDETEADIYAQASMDDMELEPLVFSFTIPLTPKVVLGDYRSIRKDVEPVEVTEEALQEALEHVRSHHEVVETVERPVELGDKVSLGGRGELVVEDEEQEDDEEQEEQEDAVASEAPVAEDGEPIIHDGEDDDDEEWEEDDDEEWEEEEDDNSAVIFDYENIDLVMDGDKLFFGQEFVDNIVGLSAGESKSFTITFPEDFSDAEYAGRQAEFNINVQTVQSRTLPPLDDELAKKEGDFASLDDLKARLSEELKSQAEGEAKDALLEGMITDLLAGLQEIIYPPAAIEQEIEDMIGSYKEQVKRSGWDWDEFLLMRGQDEADVRSEFQPSAEERLRRQLALRQFIIDERIQIRAADLEAAIDERVARFDDEKLRQGMRDYYLQGAAMEMLSNEIVIKKVVERIEAIVTGQAPDLAELELEETAVDEEE